MKKKKKKILCIYDSQWIGGFRATTSVVAKSCKIQKVVHLAHFDQKNTHISGCKIVHKCTSAIVTMHTLF